MRTSRCLMVRLIGIVIVSHQFLAWLSCHEIVLVGSSALAVDPSRPVLLGQLLQRWWPKDLASAHLSLWLQLVESPFSTSMEPYLQGHQASRQAHPSLHLPCCQAYPPAHQDRLLAWASITCWEVGPRSVRSAELQPHQQVKLFDYSTITELTSPACSPHAAMGQISVASVVIAPGPMPESITIEPDCRRSSAPPIYPRKSSPRQAPLDSARLAIFDS